MLNNLSEQVAYCYRRAGECRELAALATTLIDKTFYTEREQGWLLLARSYEFSDRAGLVIDELYRRGRKHAQPGSCPACAAPTRVCSTMLVCTNCARVVEDR
jgi:hypothetical protein